MQEEGKRGQERVKRARGEIRNQWRGRGASGGKDWPGERKKEPEERIGPMEGQSGKGIKKSGHEREKRANGEDRSQWRGR